MRFSLFALIRLVVLLSVGMVLLGVVVARLGPSPGGQRLAAPPLYDLLNRVSFTPNEREPWYLDTLTGKVQEFKLPEGDQLDYAVCSPWTDERGEYQVVGRWKSRAMGPSTAGERFEAFGLGRYEVPSGRMIDQVALDILPSSPPCWFPGTAARVLFAGGDGELYSYDFDSEAQGKATQPNRLTWQCDPPGEIMLISDPVWPRDHRLKGRLVVSLQYRVSQLDTQMTPTRLWWLMLSADGLSIVAAAPLIDPSKGDAVRSETSEERCPSLSDVPGEGLVLAYLWQARGLEHWELRLAPVRFDDRTQAPSVDSASVCTLQRHHVPSAATFSPDGRWLFGYIHDDLGHGSIVRFSTSVPLPLAAVRNPAVVSPSPRG